MAPWKYGCTSERADYAFIDNMVDFDLYHSVKETFKGIIGSMTKLSTF